MGLHRKFIPQHGLSWSKVKIILRFLMYVSLRRQWHPTPVLLPGKSMDGGAWKAVVHGVTKSRTRLSDFTFTFYFHALEKEMATHSSVLAWRTPGIGEPGGLLSMGLHRVGHDRSNLAAAAAARMLAPFPDDASGKEIHLPMQEMQEKRLDPWVRKIPWSRKWQPTSVFLPEKFHG